MPELPEVEVTRLSLAGVIRGAVVQGVRVGKPLRWPVGGEPEQWRGCVVGEVSRRGKYLWVPLLDPAMGSERGGLLFHLGMSGSLSFDAHPVAPGPHDHFDLLTSQGCLRLHDPRRFGAVVWGASREEGLVARLLAGLGVEPFSEQWTAAHLRSGLKGRRLSIKQALLAGDIVVGVGNIYASEALFRAGIHPEAASDRVGPRRCERLVTVVRDVLGEAVLAGGSTLKDFRNAQGQQGHFQLATRVYGRAGEPCKTCGTPIQRIVQGQRASYFCPRCQKR
jgi:formamidopyrimidine-DNA glycosylase